MFERDLGDFTSHGLLLVCAATVMCLKTAWELAIEIERLGGGGGGGGRERERKREA